MPLWASWHGGHIQDFALGPALFQTGSEVSPYTSRPLYLEDIYFT
jgi:hypothetical protein